MASKGNATPTVDLWVRAGVDGVRNGGCPACQQAFMILLLKAEANNLSFNVRTTSPAKPHPEFKNAGLRHCPAVTRGEEIFDQIDEIVEFLDTCYPSCPLQYFNPEADLAAANLFSKFAWYIKEVNDDPKHIDAELRRLDAYLQSEDHEDAKFATSDSLSHLDCLLLPKLQHIRVALAALKGYDIPRELKGLWTYLRNAYDCDVFTKSCPCDQEIILYWADRPDTANLSRMKHAEIANEPPSFSFSTPED